MPRISVVMPMYNVEPYLRECLESVAGQTVTDLECVMVDDGSTDSSAAIAEEFAARDPRFRLIRQPNGGLGQARNHGTEVATGELLAFVDSDDVLPPNAYELLLGALDRTGSDFATGNIHRLTGGVTRQTPFVAKAFTETRLKTHVTRFRPLLADRTAWNKLWRRSFWDAHGLRFPEGVVHEDIPVILPAHFKARSVDVIADPVYYYRIREGGELSITGRRLEPQVLLDRLAAMEQVRTYLAKEGPRKARRWYDASIVADDLRYYVNVLDRADDDYVALFLDRVNALLDRLGDRIYRPLPAIDRLKWQLVRRRLASELFEVLRFEREDLHDTAPVRVRGRWYGDYPFRTDRALGIPLHTYRLRRELTLEAQIEELSLNGSKLEIGGYAYVEGIGAPTPGSQRVSIRAVAPGRLRPVWARVTPKRVRAAERERPDVRAGTRQAVADPLWSGFRASFDLRRLRRAGRWQEGTWHLFVTVRAGGITRRRVRFKVAGPRPVRAVELAGPGSLLVRAAPQDAGEVVLDVRRQWARLASHEIEDGALVLAGELRAPGSSGLALELRRRDGSGRRRFALAVDGERFSARVPLSDVLTEASGDPDKEVRWELHVAGGGRRLGLRLPAVVDEGAWPCGDREVALTRARNGDAALSLRAPRGTVDEARWSDGGTLELAGAAPAGDGPHELVILGRSNLERHAFPMHREPSGTRFTARPTPAAIVSLAGSLPLREGTWDLYAQPPGDAPMAPLMLAPALYERMPLTASVAHKTFKLRATSGGRASLTVLRDLDDDERGRFNERRLRRTAYVARRDEPLREAVLYSSFHGRQCSDSPLLIHQELVRRGAPLEHLWVVRDGRCQVPPTATVLRAGSREYHEALARARYVVYNDHFPNWFRRRPDQVCVQTWHGTPLKRLGFDASETQRMIRRFERRWPEQEPNWQYVVSPNRFSTPILRRAYRLQGELLETGYPRDDLLARPDREVLTRRLRERLELPPDLRVILYVPTYRDHVVDSHGRHRLDLHLDVDELRAALGPDAVVLFRKHHYVVDPVPVTADGFVRDVSSYPDGTELLLAADVLVTDYSSMMFDFANTGRPMLFFTYDLDSYRDEIRGFYFDFEQTAPGPLLRTGAELADALTDLDAVRVEYARRYADFVSTFCELDDGHASARVVDRVFAL